MINQPLQGGHHVLLETALGRRKVVVWPGDPDLAPYVIVAGYCQSVLAMALWLIAKVLTGTSRTVIAVERLGIGTADRPKYIGWWGIRRQEWDFLAIVDALVAQGIISQVLPPIWITHSLGCHLVAVLQRVYPALFGGAMFMAPPVITSFGILTYLRMWADGWAALPTILWSVFTGRGCNCPQRTKRTFVGRAATAAELDQYVPVSDSGLIFCQVLLGWWYYGQAMRQLRNRAPEQKIVVIGCRQDDVMPPTDTVKTVEWLGTPLYWIDRAHCFWVHDLDDSAATTIKEGVAYLENPS